MNANELVQAEENKQPVPILMYHSISDPDKARRAFRNFTISPGIFSAHLHYLAEEGYIAMTVTQFARAVRDHRPLPARPIVITFDDGFADFYSAAFPLLQRNGFKATIYITTGFVGRTSLWLRREGETMRPMLTWDQVREISASGFECGTHTLNHVPLDTLPAETAQIEITRCKSVLQEQISTPVNTFAYPFGYYTPVIQSFLRDAGYSSACALKHDFSSTGDDLFALARLHITANTSVIQLADLLTRRQIRLRAELLRTRTKAWRIIRHGASFFLRGTLRSEGTL
jgi:O-antigen biosynthesis protein